MCFGVELYWSISVQKEKITFKHDVNKKEKMLLLEEFEDLDLFEQ